MESISVFEIIKVGIGPSSSHTMGPWNAASAFIRIIKRERSIAEVKEVFLEFFGSLAKTGIGHGTDIAGMLGLNGEDFKTINTSKIDEIVDHIKTSQILNLGGEKEIPFVYGHHLVLNMSQSLDFHPNGMIFKAILEDGSELVQDFYSVGGGFIASQEKNSIEKECVRTLYPCHHGSDIVKYCEKLGLNKMSDLILINEESWRSQEQTRSEALNIWENIKECIYKGVNKEGVLPGGLNVSRRAAGINRKLLGDKIYKNKNEWFQQVVDAEENFTNINKWIACFALSVNEENASFGRIITAPTNGASGVIPAVLMYAQAFTPHTSDDDIARFLLVAGEIGTLFKKNATISAAMGGCQAEIGVSSAMAAAGLTEILGGSVGQVLMAAEIAMEHHLGLTCDPIRGLVQIPCIERNTMGAMKAITAANIALESDPAKAKVSLDQVIQTMWETALAMNDRFKETSEGGLAIAVNVPEC
ncbi:L-serine dehydratase 2 [Chryseobacterium aquaeductus]|uniref:L-serine dehydratase n=1 Tax=Chryseobacterium aquaeductus TaxID=2675056 RepID=A0A9N8MDR2_9FLAO|nr:L-serine ammonia-lyase [Chryseobacterium aquaeductus]CAA7329595.1 L-serine dehydratase 2 [Chryseobacterium potabilaquae]CAD7797826.1 L-serine dehydratase 2 [Chryseobacterium aquaeductus]